MPRTFPPVPINKEQANAAASTLSPSIVESVAGFTAGIVATLAVHPFDVLKTRLQLDQAAQSKWGNSYRILQNIVMQEGGLH
ncbi:hypothetical protein LTS18_006860, partial [Coniosporium uncinatum]